MTSVRRSVSITLALAIALLLAVGIASADPHNGHNTYIVTGVSCEDGWEGDVLVPSGRAVPGFAYEPDGRGDAIGIIREITIADGDGNILFEFTQPGNGYETMSCSYTLEGPEFTEYYYVDVQWMERGN